MKFNLEINMDNATFESEYELQDLLSKVVENLEEGFTTNVPTNIKDSNGNTVGKWEVSE